MFIKSICLLITLIQTVISAHNASLLTEIQNHQNRNFELQVNQSNVQERSISNLLLTTRNVCSKIKGYAEIIEESLPNIHGSMMKSSSMPSQLSLVVGFRNFITGVKQIANSMETILSNPDIAENKELSLASFGILSQIESTFGTIRSFVGRIFLTYNYYVPEILLTSCLSEYMRQKYPELSFYEHPYQLFHEIISYFSAKTGTPIIHYFATQGFKSNPTPRMQQELANIRKLHTQKKKLNDMDNEISDKPGNVFMQNDISPYFRRPISSEAPRNESVFTTNEIETKLNINKQPIRVRRLSWKKCFQVYALENLVRLAEQYVI